MSLQYSAAVRNAKLDQVESTIGVSAQLVFFTGAMPGATATANSGTVISTLALPSDWMSAASGGTKAKLGSWTQAAAAASGTIGYFRIFDTAFVACHIQGTCTNTAGGGDMTLDNTVVNIGQAITVTTFTLTAGNA